ncbi:MAG TPA: universal stress protein [Xanthobacteraceae bacterium]|nr:universal stress protein [Xanthobacteraceae bacterium]
MEVKDILLALTTYPEATPVSAVDEAVAFAAAVGARISAIACAVKIQAPGNVLAGAVLDVAALVAAEAKKSSTNAKTLLTAFQDAAEKRGVFQDRILEHCLTSEAPGVLVEYARLRDLTIVPVPVGDYFDQWYAEAIIFGSGHPTLVLPHTRKRAGAFALDVVAVAWDFSRPAARAVADALPLLEKAKKVHVLTVANEKVIESRRPTAEFAKYLGRHDVDVVLDTVDAADRRIGDILESYVTSCNADMLVMGAYGHSRIREFILGGATKSMLSRPPLPIFLSH